MTDMTPMRDGREVCWRCGEPARHGWVYRFGSVQAITCDAQRCAMLPERKRR